MSESQEHNILHNICNLFKFVEMQFTFYVFLTNICTCIDFAYLYCVFYVGVCHHLDKSCLSCAKCEETLR